MSRMKHLLRKLHIGGGHCDHPQRLAETRPVVASPADTAAPLHPSPSAAAQSGRMGGGESGSGSGGGGDRTAGDECLDYNLLEEEFQVQLALAISASDPDSRSDPETAQIAAAKRISLGCSTATAVAASGYGLLEILSLHYWSYNIVNYNDKVVDGFYDVYTVSSSPLAQGRIPLLVDLQHISVSDDVNYEVILVNRTADFELQRLEQRACAVSTESQVSEHGLICSGLIQRIADIVVDRMGGPVGDADDMTRKWTARRNELRCLLNSIILPLGHLDFGLSRHRALLFKVLADKVNLPCMLVKGSYYTGTDDGAVNLIKVEDGSEYIIDLMGAPGALIPAEVHSSQLPNSFLNLRSLANVTAMPLGVGVLPDGGIEVASRVGSSRPYEAPNEPIDNVSFHVEANQNERVENESGKSLPSPQISCQTSLTTSAKATSAQKKKVKNVSKYVISAAKDPEFAQKLHAVLLESGASPPPDLFSDISPQQLTDGSFVDPIHVRDQKPISDGFQYHYDNLFPRLEQPFIPMSRGNRSYDGNTGDVQNCAAEGIAHKHNELSATNDTTNQGYMLGLNATTEPIQTDAISEAISPTDLSRLHTRSLREKQALEPVFPFDANPGQSHLQNDYIGDDNMFFRDPINTDLGNDSCGLCFGSDGQSTVLKDADEWEIPWEGLRIGERIGIGSCGEVYRADWKGTEVAVKKFLNQDFSGEALVQFRSEVEIMLRLRHPNVVRFMGAITRSPHFSILTEYIPRGSLYRLLHRHNTHLAEKRRMKIALDVAKGMNYLHTGHPTIVHRDLKSPNLLVDKNWVVKVCDFGLSRMKHHTFLSSKSSAGTPGWMAPEVLRNEPANEKCDVYSFGVILWEIVTSRIPWNGLNPMQVVGAVGFQNRRLEIPDEVDPVVAQIIHDCWLREPNLRPSFSQLMIRIQNLERFFVEGSKMSGD